MSKKRRKREISANFQRLDGESKKKARQKGQMLKIQAAKA